MSKSNTKIIECPRDAMQGIKHFIPTEIKTKYIQKLLEVGFDELDMGSFVSPKTIPQLRDTQEVIKGLCLKDIKTKLLVIVANERGAKIASEFDEVSILGYPFSVSENFQKRNTNKSIPESLEILKRIAEISDKKNKKLVVYLSMGFGNPYNEVWYPEIVLNHLKLIENLNILAFSLSDTVGVATQRSIIEVYDLVSKSYPEKEIGLHLHSRPNDWKEKIKMAYQAGCRRFDGAILGYGGCPFAEDELLGNLPTEILFEELKPFEYFQNIDFKKFKEAQMMAKNIFNLNFKNV